VPARAAGQLGIPIVQEPGDQLLADGAVEFRMVAGEVRQEAEQIIEDLPARLGGGPGQLGAVAVQALAERELRAMAAMLSSQRKVRPEWMKAGR